MKTPNLDSDPDRMIRMLEIELQQKSVRRAKSSNSRMAFRIYSLIFILLMMAAVAFALQYLTNQIQTLSHEGKANSVQSE